MQFCLNEKKLDNYIQHLEERRCDLAYVANPPCLEFLLEYVIVDTRSAAENSTPRASRSTRVPGYGEP